jgi:hypothetical protein
MIGQHSAIPLDSAAQLHPRCRHGLLPRLQRCAAVSRWFKQELTAGLKAGPGYHARYFQLKGFDKEKRQAAIQKRRGSYTG